MAYIQLEQVKKQYQMGEVVITAAEDITFGVEAVKKAFGFFDKRLAACRSGGKTLRGFLTN